MRIIEKHLNSTEDTMIYHITLGKSELELILGMSERLLKELPTNLEVQSTKSRLKTFCRIIKTELRK